MLAPLIDSDFGFRCENVGAVWATRHRRIVLQQLCRYNRRINVHKQFEILGTKTNDENAGHMIISLWYRKVSKIWNVIQLRMYRVTSPEQT